MRGGAAARQNTAVRRVIGLAAALVLAAAVSGLSGCGLTGGGIPPGVIGGGGPGPAGDFAVTGRVQSAASPYGPIGPATVTVRDASSGAVLKGPVSVFSSGYFAFSNVPGGSLVLSMQPEDANYQPVSIPFQYLGPNTAQFIIAALPVSATPASSIVLTTSDMTPVIQQPTQIQAQLSGARPPDLGPSWVAFGGVGDLSAQGPVALFEPQAAGVESIFALSGGVSSGVAVSVPAGSTGGSTPPPPPDFSGFRARVAGQSVSQSARQSARQ
jgi:hypothetical protein